MSIPNVTTDVGFSPPYNSLFTLFGQFFDHGVDQTAKGGGTVFVPLKADDPLIPGPDHVLGTNGSNPDPLARSAACADDLPASKRFMVLTRAQNQLGPDGVLGTADDIQDAKNTDSPWVDQSQTYASHASHQVFVREYVNNAAGRPVSTGALLGGPAGPTAGGMATWTTVKAQAATLLGLQLVDTDVTDIPMVAADAYGKFIPGPLRGLPQYVTKHRGLVEGNTANPVPVPTQRAVSDGGTTDLSNILTSATAVSTQDDVGSVISGPGLPISTTIGSVQSPTQVTMTANATATATGVTIKIDPGTLHFDTPFLTDIAHNADPSPVDTDHNPATPPVAPTPDLDLVASADFANQPPGTYDDEMLNAHFIAGDGRVNENIGLTTIHQIFHSEHDRLVGDIENTLTSDTSRSGVAALQEWKLAAGAAGWNGERIFQATRFVTEMEYQHLVFEDFARKVQPAINPFQPFAFTQTELNPAIKAEFAHAVYRFGHSMLTETISRNNEDQPGPDGVFGTSDDIKGSTNDISLLKGFLNPSEYTNGGPAGQLTSEQAAGSVIMGMSDQIGSELDEFVTEALRNNLLGLPLDLATINITRARSEGIPRLNVLRRELNASTNDAQLKPYTNWIDFGQNLKHPQTLINFVAAYGQHPTILTANAGPHLDRPGCCRRRSGDHQLPDRRDSHVWDCRGRDADRHRPDRAQRHRDRPGQRDDVHPAGARREPVWSWPAVGAVQRGDPGWAGNSPYSGGRHRTQHAGQPGVDRPFSDGGSPITGYQVQVRIGATVVRTNLISGTGTTAAITGLTNGTAYNFRVQASNANGPGALSLPSNTITPATVPDTPVIGLATASATATTAGSATLTWTAPLNGGSAITSYQIVATPTTGTTVTRTGIAAAATSGTVTGLVNGTTYTLQVRAVNILGSSPLSAASNPVTPTGIAGRRHRSSPSVATPK